MRWRRKIGSYLQTVLRGLPPIKGSSHVQFQATDTLCAAGGNSVAPLPAEHSNAHREQHWYSTSTARLTMTTLSNVEQLPTKYRKKCQHDELTTITTSTLARRKCLRLKRAAKRPPCPPLVRPSTRAPAPSHLQHGVRARDKMVIEKALVMVGLRALRAMFCPQRSSR